MNAALSHPRLLTPLNKRRRVVALALGGYLLFVLSVALQSLDVLPISLFALLSVAGAFLTGGGGMQLMKPSNFGLPEGTDRQLDERQWQQIARAHVLAYRGLGLFFVLCVIYFVAAQQQHLPVPTTELAWACILLGAVIFVPILPTAILAWTEPDIDP